VAGRKRWYEEATLTASEPAEPHGTQEMRRTWAFRRVIDIRAVRAIPATARPWEPCRAR